MVDSVSTPNAVGEKPLSLACVLVQRSPQPAVCVAFNQHVRVSRCDLKYNGN